MNSDLKRLLIVDQQKCVRDYLAVVCRSLKFQVVTAPGADVFQQKLEKFVPSIVLLDLALPDNGSTRALKAIKDSGEAITVLFLSGDDDRVVSVAKGISDLLCLEVGGVLKKPVMIDTLRNSLKEIGPSVTKAQLKELSMAIDSGDIRPAYQPKAVRDSDGVWRMSEVEALARWNRTDSVKEYPGQFMGIVEQAGLLPRLTNSLLKQIILQLRAWDDQGLSITAAINIPFSLLSEPEFPDRLETLMKRHMLDNSRLALEVTESAAMQEPGAATEVLGVLHKKGFGLAIDNFGAGNFSITKLNQLPFDEVKIDRFLVREVGFGDGAAEIVEAMIILGQQLDMNVCAEGVESPDVLEFLLEAGCDKMQGYLLSRACSAENLEAKVRQFEKTGLALDVELRAPANDLTRRNLPILCL